MSQTAVSLPELVLVEDCIEDELMALRGISKSGIRCHVTVQRDGAEALDHLLIDHEIPLALVVLDYKLPKVTGLEILTRLRENLGTRFTPVVIVSGTNAGQTLRECYRVGANSCVMKPDDPTQYVDRLAAIAHYWLTVNHSSDDYVLTSSRRMLEG